MVNAYRTGTAEKCRRFSCDHKERFTSTKIAESVARKMVRRRRIKHNVVKAYRCGFCGGFHIGSSLS